MSQTVIHTLPFTCTATSCRNSSSLATKTKKRMMETSAATTTSSPQNSPVFEFRQSTPYLGRCDERLGGRLWGWEGRMVGGWVAGMLDMLRD